MGREVRLALMLFTVAVLVAVLVCDFAIAWLDPRARAKG